MTIFGKRVYNRGVWVTTTEDFIIVSHRTGIWKKYQIGDMLSNGRTFTKEMLEDIRELTEQNTTESWSYRDDLEMWTYDKMKRA